MKKIILLLTLALSLFSSEYKVDEKQSNIKFSASKFLFVGVEGEFSEFSGEITINDKNEISKINGLVLSSSINTENEERDEHLKADDYFNIISYPKIKFESKNITDNIVNATVSIKGIKKDLDFRLKDININKNEISFNLESTVNRQEFMLNGSKSAIIADNVDVSAKILAIKQ